jgi:hypothetical protein
MSLYQTGPPRPRVLAKALVAPAPLLDTGFAIVKAELLPAVRTHRVADALFVFAIVILPMAAMITLLFLLSSAGPTAAVPGVASTEVIDTDHYVQDLRAQGIW